jgi:hypothetical protein
MKMIFGGTTGLRADATLAPACSNPLASAIAPWMQGEQREKGAVLMNRFASFPLVNLTNR